MFRDLVNVRSAICDGVGQHFHSDPYIYGMIDTTTVGAIEYRDLASLTRHASHTDPTKREHGAVENAAGP
jgi:hypothetical protein